MRQPPRPGARARRPLSPGRRRPSLEALEERLVMAAPTLGGYLDVGFPENVVNSAPQLLNANVVVADADQDWAGGTLTVSGLLPEDRAGILAAGGVALVGNDIRFNGTTIGAVGSGIGQTGVGEPLVVTFNDSATNAGVQAVVRALTYQDVSDTPVATRRLSVVLADAFGDRSIPGQIDANYTSRAGAADPFPTSGLAIHVDPELGDVDGDGDLDLLIGFNDGSLSFYRNVGTAAAPVYVLQTGSASPFDGIGVSGSASPALDDFDGDGDLDLAVGNNNGTVDYFRNDGTASSPEYIQQFGAANPFGEIGVPAYSRLAVGDVDGDGKLDLLVGGSSNTLSYYRNTGTTTSPAFALQTGSSNPFSAITLGFYNSPTLGDVDGDGDLDFLDGLNDGTLHYYLNAGTSTSPSFVPQAGPSDPFDGITTVGDAHPHLIDTDGDGVAEALIGDLNGNLSFHGKDRYSLEVTVTPEAEVPPVLLGGNIPLDSRPGGPAVAVDPNLVILNPSGANLATASVSIGANFTPSEDRLSFDDQNGITGSYNVQTGILTLTGLATADAYQAALRSVRYQDINADVATANRVPRSISFSIAPGTYNPANGHFYEFVAAPGITWTDARAAAAARNIFGVQGYLATITSSDENTFAFSKIQAAGWIGASDAAEEGVWKWVEGPEAGLQFWQGSVGGSPVDGQFVNWGPNQPDNAQSFVDGSFENYAQFDANGFWNDLPNYDPWSAPYGPIEGYLVEYGGLPEDPILQLTSRATVNVVVLTAAPTVSGPATALVVGLPSALVSGTAEPGSLVQIYRDANNNGVLDDGEAVVGSRQLAVGQTAYSIAVDLTPNVANDFLVTATAEGETESDPVDVPTVTSDATAPAPPTLTSPTMPVAINASTALISGTAEAGSLVQVFDDANGNGVLDDGEAVVGSRQLAVGLGAFSIAVPLAPGVANRFLVTSSDAVGNRSAPAVVPAILQDAIAPAAPAVSGPSAPATVNVTNLNIAGTAEPGSLVTAYRDRNGDGVIGEGDEVVGVLQLGPGQSAYSITVPLTAGDLNRFLVTSTDAAGNASAPEVVPAIVQDSTAPASPVVAEPSSALTVDAASYVVAGTAEAGSLVVIFGDSNGNGVIDAGDAVVGSLQLAPGQTAYRIAVPLARGATNRFLVTSTDAAGNVSAPTAVPTITTSATIPEGRSSLGGRLFDDLDGDGVQDPGEAGLANLSIVLEGADVDGNPVHRVVITNADGTYLFLGLRPGVYSLILPGGNTSAGVAGSLGGTSQGGRIDGIVVGDGTDGVGYSFAVRISAPTPVTGPEPLPTTGRLAGRVYLDRNRNGVYDAGRDFGIATIRVILTGVDDRGMTVRVVTTTDATGAYLFEGLRPGTYSVRDVRTPYFRDARSASGSRIRVVAEQVKGVVVEAGATSAADLGKVPIAGCRLIPLMGPGGVNKPVPRGPLFRRFFPTLTPARPARTALRGDATRHSAARGKAGPGMA